MTEPNPAPAPLLHDVNQDQLKEHLAAELLRSRERSLGLTVAVLDEVELTAQHSRLMSPLVWDLAHIGNYEELWLLREAAGIEPLRPEIDDIYDAFEHPRAERPSLPLLSSTESQQYLNQVRSKVIDSLETLRLDDAAPRLLGGGFVHAMVIQHEHQHNETMLATHQLRRGAAVLTARRHPAERTNPAELPPERVIEGGYFEMGTSTHPWAYDNERPAHQVYVATFALDTLPVSNRQYAEFIADAGYDRPALWSESGWNWRNESGKRSPAFWLREGEQWLVRRLGAVEVLDLDEAVQHVCYYEAQAYARWAGRRLPTEAEWEKAASWDPVAQRKRLYPWGDQIDPTAANWGQQHLGPSRVGSYPTGESAYGVRQMLGDVWEWTSTDFTAHPGFCMYPYPEYSEVFFGPEYKVLRGGSWATDSTACRNTFRNWDYPIRRQIFAGFRTARDGEA